VVVKGLKEASVGESEEEAIRKQLSVFAPGVRFRGDMRFGERVLRGAARPVLLDMVRGDWNCIQKHHVYFWKRFQISFEELVEKERSGAILTTKRLVGVFRGKNGVSKWGIELTDAAVVPQ
jgi:hypothetical protein